MKLLKTLFNPINLYKCQKNYKNKLKELKNKKPIRVIFLVRENQKWQYQTLYQLLEEDKNFEPLVLVSLLYLVHKGKDKTRNNLEENYNFFKERNINVDYAYKNGEYINLKEFNPDIVFYDQPWDLPKIHNIPEVSNHALTCYASYGCEITDSKDNYSDWHSLLFRFFVDSSSNYARYCSYNKYAKYNCRICGFLKIDEYLNNFDSISRDDKFTIIYAPHHSVDKKSLKMSTFPKTANYILDFAKKQSNINWIFKPHPRLKYAIIKNKVMSEYEAENYYKEWQKIGVLHNKGDYINLFKNSDLLITDSVSFLVEYLPTHKPIIRLQSPKQINMGSIGNKICKVCYEAKSIDELESIFDKVVMQKVDTKQEGRLKLSNTLFSSKEPAAKKICEYLLNDLWDIKI